jgi:hypothetical protein
LLFQLFLFDANVFTGDFVLDFELGVEFDSPGCFEEFGSFLFFSEENEALPVDLFFPDDAGPSLSIHESLLFEEMFFTDESFPGVLSLELFLLSLPSEKVVFILTSGPVFLCSSNSPELIFLIECFLDTPGPPEFEFLFLCKPGSDFKVLVDSGLGEKYLE